MLFAIVKGQRICSLYNYFFTSSCFPLVALGLLQSLFAHESVHINTSSTATSPNPLNNNLHITASLQRRLLRRTASSSRGLAPISPLRLYTPPPLYTTTSVAVNDTASRKTPNGIKMCNYFKNYYIYSTCQNPAAHFLRTSLDGNKDTRCAESPHDRFIVVVGKCLLCAVR